jgi:hypothetical protein
VAHRPVVFRYAYFRIVTPSVSGLFKWRQFEPEVILLAVGWYLSFTAEPPGDSKAANNGKYKAAQTAASRSLRMDRPNSCHLTHASTFDVYTREQMRLAAGDVVRFTKNFVAKGGKCRNNDLATVQTVTSDHVTTSEWSGDADSIAPARRPRDRGHKPRKPGQDR